MLLLVSLLLFNDSMWSFTNCKTDVVICNVDMQILVGILIVQLKALCCWWFYDWWWIKFCTDIPFFFHFFFLTWKAWASLSYINPAQNIIPLPQNGTISFFCSICSVFWFLSSQGVWMVYSVTHPYVYLYPNSNISNSTWKIFLNRCGSLFLVLTEDELD